ncbi:hypothetical protein BSKO_11278 [Bryopsis sp. KO-2023]|nr:hypothetical protein BSKO_11278 [Bryopsis sp. KO-2023]
MDAEESEKCLSMHQPWASLLVAGIKRIEGRSWTTKLRGRLWIHATQKVPKREEIDELETFYRTLFEMLGQEVVFPEHYPSGVLLGSVEVVDCMKAEEVKNWDGLAETLKLEVLCPMCFLCENPRKLVLPQKMRGYQGIWNLPKKTVKNLLPALKTSAVDPTFSWKNYMVDLTKES